MMHYYNLLAKEYWVVIQEIRRTPFNKWDRLRYNKVCVVQLESKVWRTD